MTNQLIDTETADVRWNWLYKIGGAAALFGVAIIPMQLIVFIVWGQPDTALGWFTLFQSNKLAGLLAFELLFVINAALGIATALALYVALRRVNESLMVIATALSFVEAVALIVARPALEMLYLSHRYAAAATEGQRAMFLAAGETMWATFNGTAFHLSYNLSSIYLLIVPVVMLQSNIFRKPTAYVGILAAIFNWGLRTADRLLPPDPFCRPLFGDMERPDRQKALPARAAQQPSRVRWTFENPLRRKPTFRESTFSAAE